MREVGPRAVLLVIIACQLGCSCTIILPRHITHPTSYFILLVSPRTPHQNCYSSYPINTACLIPSPTPSRALLLLQGGQGGRGGWVCGGGSCCFFLPLWLNPTTHDVDLPSTPNCSSRGWHVRPLHRPPHVQRVRGGRAGHSITSFQGSHGGGGHQQIRVDATPVPWRLSHRGIALPP